MRGNVSHALLAFAAACAPLTLSCRGDTASPEANTGSTAVFPAAREAPSPLPFDDATASCSHCNDPVPIPGALLSSAYRECGLRAEDAVEAPGGGFLATLPENPRARQTAVSCLERSGVPGLSSLFLEQASVLTLKKQRQAAVELRLAALRALARDLERLPSNPRAEAATREYSVREIRRISRQLLQEAQEGKVQLLESERTYVETMSLFRADKAEEQR